MQDSPKSSMPMTSSMHPARKARSMAKSGFVPLVNSSVSRAMSEVGPIEISLTEPKIV